MLHRADGYTMEHLVFRFADKNAIQYREGAMHSTNFLVDGFLMDHCDSKTSTGELHMVLGGQYTVSGEIIRTPSTFQHFFH